jgi:ribosomal protein S18 acetylase RimI-like enzyme
MKCHYDERTAHYRCARSGEFVCLDHARLDVVSISTRTRPPPVPVRPAEPADFAAVRQIALMYWGETEVECFGRRYDVLRLPAWIACAEEQAGSASGAAGRWPQPGAGVRGSDGVAGVLSYAVEDKALNIVMLNVHPEHQGRHLARSLLATAEGEAHRLGLCQLVVATTNDDLPALYMYQRCGFVISDVLTGTLVTHHGHEETGFAGIPVRDEIRLAKLLASQSDGA